MDQPVGYQAHRITLVGAAEGSGRARQLLHVICGLHQVFLRLRNTRRAQHRRQQACAQITTTRLLIQAQPELRQHRQQVTENIALNPLVIGPHGGAILSELESRFKNVEC